MEKWTMGPTLQLILQSLITLAIFPSVLGGIEVEPHSASGVVPLGQQAVFYCKAGQGFRFSTWDVSNLATSAPNEASILSDREITSNVSDSVSESYLIVNATPDNNNITIQCEVRDSTPQFNPVLSSVIRTQFYGPPSTPTNLMIRSFINGQLHVVWDFSSSIPPGVQTVFSLIAVRNNSNTQQQNTTTHPGLMNITALINVAFSFCDVYYLWVRASNNAGDSERSQAVMWIPPYQSSFSTLSLSHSLSKTDTGVFVTVAVQVPQNCREYSQAMFDVVLESFTGTEIRLRQKAMQEAREQLAEDQIYFLEVQSNGESLTPRYKIVTSDIQGVEVCTEDNFLNIHCLFITGSTVNGCGYTLVGVANTTGYIARSNSQGTRLEVSNIFSYNRVVVYDSPGQADNPSNGVSVTKHLQNLSKCLLLSDTPPTEGFTNASKNSTVTNWLIIFLPIAVALTSIIMVFTIITMICCYRKWCSVSRDKHHTGNTEFHCEEIQEDLHQNLQTNEGVRADLQCDVNPSYEATITNVQCETNPSYDVVGATKSNNGGKVDVVYETIPSIKPTNNAANYDVIF